VPKEITHCKIFSFHLFIVNICYAAKTAVQSQS
jgi:hypothetical protein